MPQSKRRMSIRSLFRGATACALSGVLMGSPLLAQAQAQACPPGYYYASDGLCYPGTPPNYPPPIYDPAPPVSPPPVVADGMMIGLGLLLGAALLGGDGDGHRAPEMHRPAPRRGPPERRDHR